VGIVFLLGLLAAAYASADSALTALTTSFCIDFLHFGEDSQRMGIRNWVHVSFSVLFVITILVFHKLNNDSVIYGVLKLAGYTYGPLLGMFAFGILTRYKANDQYVIYWSLASPLLCYLLDTFSESLFMGYTFGFELLILNGLIVFTGLILTRKRSNPANDTKTALLSSLK
jgi:Na+/proline symporter